MPSLQRSKRAIELLRSALAHSAEAREYLARLPEYLKGRAAARSLHTELAAPAPASPSANPLRAWFDSVERGPGIWKWMHYFDVYHRHFARFIGAPVDVVEVGVYSGGSLGMWQDYFGPAARIHGLDIEPACKTYERGQVKIFIGDQSDRAFWNRFHAQVPAYDIVIDDGGHLAHQQTVTLDETLKHLRPGGVYVCEDIHGVANRFSAYTLALIDELNAWGASQQVDEKHLRVETTAFQRAAFSLHLYPFMLVIERSGEPLTELAAIKHGTQWQPFL